MRLSFAEPIAAPESIAGALDRLIGALCRHLAAEQLGARRLSLALYRVDGSFERRAIGTSRANRDPVALKRLFLPHLERVDPGFGIETMVLAAPLVQAASDLQMVLGEAQAERLAARAASQGETRSLPPAPDRPPPASPKRSLPVERGDAGPLVADLVDRLANDREPARLYRPAQRESHLPERAVARAAALAEPSLPWGEPPLRPIRLLARPEPIEVDPADPVALPALFFWRQRPHRLRRIEGPERIAPEWWSLRESQPASRDYFRVEDMEGRRFWLYREAVEQAASAASPRWYLHGLFA
jgi:protein ImuB